MEKFSNIRTRNDLAELLGIKKSVLTYVLYKATNDRSFVEKKDLFIEELEKEIVKAGFAINQKKTRMCLRSLSKKVAKSGLF